MNSGPKYYSTTGSFSDSCSDSCSKFNFQFKSSCSSIINWRLWTDRQIGRQTDRQTDSQSEPIASPRFSLLVLVVIMFCLRHVYCDFGWHRTGFINTRACTGTLIDDLTMGPGCCWSLIRSSFRWNQCWLFCELQVVLKFEIGLEIKNHQIAFSGFKQNCTSSAWCHSLYNT